MGSLIFFGASFVALVSAAFMYANSENSKANDANKKVDQALDHVQALDSRHTDLEIKIKELTDKIDELTLAIKQRDEASADQLDKHKQKIDYLELKSQNVAPKTRVVLTQDKPLNVNIIYKKYEPKPQPKDAPPPLPESQIKKPLLNKLKKQIQELSQ